MLAQNLGARQSPSTDKLRYLVHLEDCRQSSFDGLSHALKVLETFQTWTHVQQNQRCLWDGGKSFETRFTETQTDLEHLVRELTALQLPIRELKQTLHEHLDLTHNRRNSIITIVAAVYVPLSFATGLFGMNINTTTSAGPSGFSNWTQSWIDHSPVETRDQTRALVSTIGSSSPLTHSWRVFAITAACLVVTLPLSLAIGAIIRQIYRNTIHYALYWRAFAVIPSVIFVFFSIFGSLIGTDVADVVFTSWSEGGPVGWVDAGGHKWYGVELPLWFAVLYWMFEIMYWICNGSLLLFELLRGLMLMKSGMRSGFWFFMFFVSGVCFIADMLQWQLVGKQYFPTMLVPWSMFAYGWFRPWWRSKQRAKIVKDAAAGEPSTT